jgi:chaperonin GroEL
MGENKEIKSGKELRDKLKEGINKLASAVSVTLGPNGGTVIIANEFGDPYITKDGVSVSNYVELDDPIENIAAKLLKQVAEKTVELAGDGTSTAIVLACALINKGFSLLDSGIPYKTLKIELELFEKNVTKYLIESAVVLNKKNIIDVATISANNDVAIGELIQKAYNHSTIVKVEEGVSIEDSLVLIDGMELDTSYFSNSFINKADQQAVEYEDPLILLIDGKLDSLDNIKKILLDIKTTPLVIIADYFTDQVMSLLKDNYNRGALNIVPVKSPGFAGHRKNLIYDIADYSGAIVLSPFTKQADMSYLGKLKNIFITKHKCTLLNDVNNEVAIKTLSNLESTLKLATDSNDIALLTQRITNLTGKVALIKVGGSSEVEMKERKDRIDDAVLAVKSALEEGVVEGGGVALIKAGNKLDKNNFLDCLSTPYRIIFNYPVSNKDRESKFISEFPLDMFKQNIIDPLKVTRCALQNATSVAKTILSTEAIVLDKRLWR